MEQIDTNLARRSQAAISRLGGKSFVHFARFNLRTSNSIAADLP